MGTFLFYGFGLFIYVYGLLERDYIHFLNINLCD